VSSAYLSPDRALRDAIADESVGEQECCVSQHLAVARKSSLPSDELLTKDPDDLDSLKTLIVDTARKVNWVLADPPPEAFVVDLVGPESSTVKLQITWWTENSRQHQMMASHDRVLTAISKAFKRLAVDDSHDKRPRAA
jgi:hypothetical protein